MLSLQKKLKEKKIIQDLNMLRLYLTSAFLGVWKKNLFDDVETYCLFIGHGRSGHSILGALLDAHPNIVLPDEVDTLKYLQAGFKRKQIYQVLLMKSKKQAKQKRAKDGLADKVYSYWVPNQWQGRFKKLQIIGDSKAGVSVRRLAASPHLIEKLRNTVKVNIKVIHVTRNPYDNISTMALRKGSSLDVPIEGYFNNNCKALEKVRADIPEENMLLVRHEDLIVAPQETLKRVCHFLGVSSPKEYLAACASIIYQSPSLTRNKVHWDPVAIENVQREIEKYNFLKGYSYFE